MNTRFLALSEQEIRLNLDDVNLNSLDKLTLFESTESTNAYLLSLPAEQANGHAVIADHQLSGRGRRGRSWHSPPGCNIYLSLGWRFPAFDEYLSQLPLVVAIAVVRTVISAGVAGAGIKWPNDILLKGRKLAGILVDMRSSTRSGSLAVIGVGLNVRMPGELITAQDIEQDWTDVCSNLRTPVDEHYRNELCSCLLNELLSCICQFEQSGFELFADEWNRHDLLRGRNVVISDTHVRFEGRAEGISSRGGLLVSGIDPLEVDQIKEFLAGDVSVRSV